MPGAGLPRFDVAVIGAGSAGVAAALAAARAGARTLLLEATDRLGGNASLAQVHTICGLYEPAHGDESSGARAAHGGWAGDVPTALQRIGAAGPPERAGKVHYLPIDPDGYAQWLRAEVDAQAGLELRLEQTLERVRQIDDGFTLEAGASRFAASLLVDASGAAIAADRLGADRVAEPADRLQCPSLILRLDGVETDELSGYARLHVTTAVAKAARDGALSAAGESVVVRPGLRRGEVFLTLGVPRPPAYRPLDADHLDELGRSARACAEEVLGFLRTHRPAFASAQVAAWPVRLGVREAARGKTAIELDRNDILQGRRRPDEVALSTWPIELWRDHRRARFEHPSGPCGIPLGALVSASHPRLAFSGRCMGGTQESLGALRVIGTALATGEAAGVAAALAADAGTDLSRVEPAAVRSRILRDDVRVLGEG